MKNILITGGAGYIGSHICIELLNANYNPIIIDNPIAPAIAHPFFFHIPYAPKKGIDPKIKTAIKFLKLDSVLQHLIINRVHIMLQR